MTITNAILFANRHVRVSSLQQVIKGFFIWALLLVWLGYRDEFCCFHMGNFSAVDRDAIKETQPKWWNVSLAVVAVWTLQVLLIKLIRILLKWKYIQDKIMPFSPLCRLDPSRVFMLVFLWEKWAQKLRTSDEVGLPQKRTLRNSSCYVAMFRREAFLSTQFSFRLPGLEYAFIRENFHPGFWYEHIKILRME